MTDLFFGGESAYNISTINIFGETGGNPVRARRRVAHVPFGETSYPDTPFRKRRTHHWETEKVSV